MGGDGRSLLIPVYSRAESCSGVACSNRWSALGISVVASATGFSKCVHLSHMTSGESPLFV